MAVTYCTSSDIFSFLQLGKKYPGKTDFDDTTLPKNTEIEDWINESEDDIDFETMHAWREKTVTNEVHHLNPPVYHYRDGYPISLSNRSIKELDSNSGDKLEIWDGSKWEDYLTERTEGRNKDYWVDTTSGIIWIKLRYGIYKYFLVRVTYRYGESIVPKNVKRACVNLTAIRVLMSDDRTVILPEGTDNMTYDNKIKDMREEAEKIIFRMREIKVIST
jgi:hypothetical protein